MRPPRCGIGIVYVPGLEPLLEPGHGPVDVIEIEPQTLWTYRPGSTHPYRFPDDAVKRLKQFPQPKLLHSVGFGVGGSRAPDAQMAEALKHAAETLDCAWASEHLALTWFESNGELVPTGFMLPSLQSEAGVDAAIASVRDLAGRLPVPLAVETTVNYLRPRLGELSDGEFVSRVAEGSDCGILLDLHNIWANDQNGRQSVDDFLATIPLERVWELHVAGGFDFEGYWLDSHSGAVPPPVRDLLRKILPRLPNLGALIYEIFESFIPTFGLDGVEKELNELRLLWDDAQSDTPQGSETSHVPLVVQPESSRGIRADDVTPEIWERTLGELVTTGESGGPLAAELVEDDAIELMRKLIWRFRAGAITKVMCALTRLVFLHSGPDRFEQLLDAYIAATRPQPFAAEEARAFIRFLNERQLDIPYLDGVLAYEEALIEASLSGVIQIVKFDYDPVALMAALAENRLPESLTPGRFELEVAPEVAQPYSSVSSS